MEHHLLDAVLESHSAGVAGPARAPQLQQHNTILKSPEVDIATILLDCRANTRFEQFLDHGHDFIVIFVVCQSILGALLALASLAL